jgi:hypothetical protein
MFGKIREVKHEETVPDRESGSDAERAPDERHLPNDVIYWQPPNLTLADIHDFVCANRVQGTVD